MGNLTGKSIGLVKGCDVCEDGTGWGKVLRVLIEIDIHHPIPRGQTNNLSRVVSWISLTYENFPCLCFRCGRIAHELKFCDKGGQNLLNETEQFGTWLRADRNKRPPIERPRNAS